MDTDSQREVFADNEVDPPVRGFLDRPSGSASDGGALTHGAGGNSRGSLLVALAEVFAGAGLAVLRCDLPFRQKRPFGPPRPGDANRDREGLKNALGALRKLVPGKIFIGGQSYGGRQSSMLCAEEEKIADALLLLSYPLHPPGKPDQLRTQHLPKLKLPVLFVQGTADPFGAIDEIKSAIDLIPGKAALLQVNGAGHDLGFKGKTRREELPGLIVTEFRKLLE
jgi:uncharacterized protein